ncbi:MULTISPECIES: serine/threonine-protein kinase [Gordonia]|uniref:non-specific serine/threonine protein kinase n=1 Tax=Gordonia sihwensis NBRC 108236 TaxID=1223544 RepID=L7LHG8_9ACTN|nr:MULTISPECIES: serine/threonine-protein kinase [Gordonia]AUH68110.1 serine/threonine protein kinase [Gordonia sp. YC-JH1]GAC60344.1 putative serine/threonine protein kinase [Gordonia sihwensis NBRC 108236]
MFGIGDDIAGYRVQAVLGAGGMGEVYEAAHPRLPRSDAIKVLRSAHGSDPVVRRRFEREADLMAPLTHPNLVRVYDRGGFGDVLWIAMELVPGTDASKISKASPAGMDPRLVVNIVNGVAAGLDVAHRHGVLHRDVKPANILITPGGDPVNPEAVKVTDFGIAQALGEAGAGLTSTGTTVGTMRYCSPEQIDGRRVDARSDIYSLAATTFELLTGSAPYDSTSLQGLMTAHLFAEPPRASERTRSLPPAVDDVLRAGLAKDPAARPPTATAFARALYSAFTGGPVNVTPSGPMFANTPGAPVPGPHRAGGPSGPALVPTGNPDRSHGDHWYRRTPALATVAVVAALALGVGGAFAWNSASGLSTPSSPEAKMTAEGVDLSWPAVSGAEQYLIKQDDVVIDVTDDNSYVVRSPVPGEHSYSVAARSTSSGGSAFSDRAELTVTQTWGEFLDMAKLYPELVPATPVNSNGFESLWCRGLGPYPVDDDQKTSRLIVCDKIDGADRQYSVQIAAYANSDDAGTAAVGQLPITAPTDFGFKTAQGTKGRLSTGVQSSEARAVFVYSSSDDPRARTYVEVAVPDSKDPKQARAIMERLPF